MMFLGENNSGCMLIIHSQPVQQIIVDDGRAVGVLLEGGEEVRAKVILSNATPKVTFFDLLQEVMIESWCLLVVLLHILLEDLLADDFKRLLASIDYSSGVTKLNGKPI